MPAPGGRGEEIISKRAVLLYEVGTASKLRVLPNINSNFKWPLLLNRTEGNRAGKMTARLCGEIC